MNELTEQQKQDIWDEVRAEFPDDEMMQEIHYVRLLHYYQTRGMSTEEVIRFYSSGKHKPAA